MQTVQSIILLSPPPSGPLFSSPRNIPGILPWSPSLKSKEYNMNPSLVLFTIMSKGYTRNPLHPPVGPLYSGRFKEYTRNPNLILFTQVQGVYQESFPDPLFSGSRSIPGIPTWSSYLRVKEYTRNPFLILLS